jgi:type IV pilus assembly protein PilN
MIKINLLPVKAAKKKEKVMTQVYVGLLIILFSLAALGYRWYSQQTKIETVKGQITETKAEIEKLREAQKKFEELKKKKLVLERQIEAITKLDRGRDWFIRVLDKVTESVPHNQVWITNLKMGGKQRRARKSAGAISGAKAISIKGKAYDKDSVAHFMGNLSIISCDDDLPDEEKAPVCQLRNERCLKFDTEKNQSYWDFEGCRRFYKEACEEVKSCKDNLGICKLDKNQICKEPGKKKECKQAKEKCAALEEQCNKARANCSKLHEAEYVVYDSVRLNSLTTKGTKAKAGGVPIYSYDIQCAAKNVPKK